MSNTQQGIKINGGINMLNRFQRPIENEDYGRVLEGYIKKMKEVLDEVALGAADREQLRSLIASLIKEQDENGFWSLIPSPRVDGDIRVLYWYEPTYIAAAIMIACYLDDKHEAERIPGFISALEKGLKASTGRGLNGHGFDDIRGRLNGLQIFAKGRVLEFIEKYPGISPDFSTMLTEIMNWLRAALDIGNTKGSWGEDYRADMENTLKLLTQKRKVIRVFVYGTLMKGSSLGNYEGVEIVTITNGVRRPSNKPSDEYLKVIRMGIKETYPEMSDFDVMKYLVECGLE
jgi:hypothetical protein